MRNSLLILCLSLLAFTSSAQIADSIMAKKIADEILTNGQAYENLRHLTKKIGPRLAGSTGMVKSEKWGLEMMQQAGADKSWLQQCMVPYWVRGGKDVAEYSIDNANGLRSADVIALGNSIGGKAKGKLIMVSSFEELDKRKDEVKGKVVFFNYKFNPTFTKTFMAYSDAVKYRGGGPSAAAKYGAVGAVIRSMSHGDNNHPHTGGTRYDEAYPKIPAVAIGLKDADLLADLIAAGKGLYMSIATHGYFKPDTIGHNVIGELRGTEFPDEIITIGGHLDSWDNCEGAHDDGAGCVQTIEILRAFKALDYKPKRTIRFVLFANEENGLRGGTKYAQEAKEKGEKHVFALESDAGGFTPRGFGFTVSKEQFEKIKNWQSVLAPYGGSELVMGGGGADIGPLNQTFGTPVAGLSPDSQRYFDLHHARNDTFEAVNKRELELGAVNMAILVYLVDKYGL
ncbi:MAG: M20/M25/M40 family metallo-hydrolase [Chitinophagaceae bacterium]|nr:M20/M25/M40 family metallo-hydrolase [Chitinophagaceae bacterium]